MISRGQWLCLQSAIEKPVHKNDSLLFWTMCKSGLDWRSAGSSLAAPGVLSIPHSAISQCTSRLLKELQATYVLVPWHFPLGTADLGIFSWLTDNPGTDNSALTGSECSVCTCCTARKRSLRHSPQMTSMSSWLQKQRILILCNVKTKFQCGALLYSA